MTSRLLRFVAFVLLVIPRLALAAGLGDIAGEVSFGQPLAIRVPLIGIDGRKLNKDCVRLTPVPGESPDEQLTSAWITIAPGSLAIASRQIVTQPVIGFRVQIDCGIKLVRDYRVLPLIPDTKTDGVAIPVMPSLSAASLLPEQSIPRQTVATDFTVTEQTTLRLLSRKRYPTNSTARVAFIRQVALANPEIFATVKTAFDQTLPAGLSLKIPTKKLSGIAATANVAKPTSVQRPVLSQPSSTGKGRLIIGGSALPVRSTSELDADIDRLVGIMNEQIQVQISMAKRLNYLEAEVNQAKQSAGIQRSVTERLDADVRELRETQRINSYIQLLLAVLLGGFAVAAVLLWREQQRNKDREGDHAPAPLAAPNSKFAIPKKQPMQSVFDDLLPPN
jgi:hypothetical protein